MNTPYEMSEAHAREVCERLKAELPGYEWSVRQEQGEWRVCGVAMNPYRALEVRAGCIARYYANATLQSVEYDCWSGSADDPLDALREAMAGFNGRWEDQALHTAHMIAVLRERRAELMRDVAECDEGIETLEAELKALEAAK